ncbi:MAG: hypothetical protein SFY81_04190 [Verrucomicrobiota bacterium]|nr:hypothetical protein [Verrucomicrobiota bacterium]
MGTNRRLNGAPVRFGSAIKVGFLCSFFVLSAIGYVWQKSQIFNLGRQIKAYELRLDELRKQKEMLNRVYAAMCSPRELDERVRRMNLGLGTPHPSQIIRLQPSRGTQPVVEAPKLYANSGK